jgi:hypothetical protein
VYWDVEEVQPVGNRRLAVKFADGLMGTLRISPAFCTGVFAPLLDDQLLDQATIQYGVITWPNGLDLAPDTLYAQIKRSPRRFYDVGQQYE